MKIFSKIQRLFTLFPYFPVGLEGTLMAQYRQSIQYSQLKYRVLFYVSGKFCQLSSKDYALQKNIFNHEINVLGHDPNKYILQKHLFHIYIKGSKSDNEIINNKEQFYKFCSENKLPTPQIVGKIKNGIVQSFGQELPWQHARDFFVKPVYGSKSNGILEFRAKGKDTYEILDENRLIKTRYIPEYLEFHFKKGEFIIQEKIGPPQNFTVNKHSHTPILRIISCKMNNQILILNPVLILHKEKKFLDSKLSNKDFFAIDEADGKVLGPIVFDHTPTKPDNLTLPEWESLLDLIEKGHNLLKSNTVIGWDVAISDEGYYLLEANKCPWLEIHQKKPFKDLWFLNNILLLI